MSRFTCRCGFSWDTTSVPESNQWVAYSSQHDEKVIALEIESSALSYDNPVDREKLVKNDLLVSRARTTIYECDKCGGLTWYRGDSDEPEFYLPS